MGTNIMNRQYPEYTDPNYYSSRLPRDQDLYRDHHQATSGPVPSSRPNVPSPRPNTGSTASTSGNGNKQNGSAIEQVQRFAGLGVGLGSVCAEYLISHPCIVLRRQCQVHHASQWHHLTPFTLFQTIFNIQRHQSITTLWKGLGSTFILKGISVGTESAISEFTPLPKEASRHSSLKKLSQHMLLKGLSFVVISPFYASSLVETVQSEIASEKPGVFDCLREGMTRLVGWNMPQTTRLLPIWKLVVPSTVYLMSRYITLSLTDYTVSLSMHTDTDVKDNGDIMSLYQSYYPQLVATFTGNLIADVMLYPMETVLHRLCVQGTRTIIDNTDTGLDVVPIITRYEGFFDCLKNIVMEEGFSGLYKGFGMVFIQYAIHLMLLKLAKFLFERLTESHRRPPMLDITPERSAGGDGVRTHPTNYRQPPPRGYRQAYDQSSI